MNHLRAAIAATAIIVSTSPTLAAAKFAPTDTKFTLAGTMMLQQSQGSTGFDCAIKFSGVVTGGGKLKITRATFCAGVQASALPWIWQANLVRPPIFYAPMAFTINGFDCGAFGQDGFDDSGIFGVLNQISANGCDIVTGSATSTPTITIRK